MNIIKGLDRIALVIAIIAIPLSFFQGVDDATRSFTTLTPEYKQWEKQNQGSILSKSFPTADSESAPTKYQYPPAWKIFGLGLLYAVASFPIVFFGIKGITRLFVWIGKGFKDEKKE